MYIKYNKIPHAFDKIPDRAITPAKHKYPTQINKSRF